MLKKLTKAQMLMVEDGLPAAAIVPDEERAAVWKGRRLRPTKSFADPRPARHEAPETRRLRKELEAAEAKKKAERSARRKEMEAENRARIAELKAKLKPAAEAAPQETESTMTTKAKTKAKAKAKAKAPKAAKKAAPRKAAKAAKQNARTAAGKDDVVQKIADMMASADGASMEEMVKATGIHAHPMRAKIKLVRDRLGYATTAPCKDNGYRYHALPPKSRALLGV